jgi:hypothetical protein
MEPHGASQPRIVRVKFTRRSRIALVLPAGEHVDPQHQSISAAETQTLADLSEKLFKIYQQDERLGAQDVV